MMLVSMSPTMATSFSPGACRVSALNALAPRGALACLGLLFLFVSILMPVADAAPVCPHCEGWITDCPGGDACPFVTTMESNGAASSSSTIGKVP